MVSIFKSSPAVCDDELLNGLTVTGRRNMSGSNVRELVYVRSYTKAKRYVICITAHEAA